MKLQAIPRQHSIRPQRRSRQTASVATLQLAQCILQISLSHQPARKVSADDEVVDILEQLLHARIDLIQIGDNRYPGLTSPGRRHGRRGRIIAIDKQSTRIHDPVALKIVRLQNKPFIPAAKHRPLSCTIDEDQ